VIVDEPSHIQDSERRRLLFATLMLVLLCVIWGMTFPATRSALAVTDPLQFLALRFGLAIILTTPFMVIRWLRISKQEASSRERIIPTWFFHRSVGCDDAAVGVVAAHEPHARSSMAGNSCGGWWSVSDG